MTTETLWITRERVTVLHIKGLLEGLQQGGALDYAEVRILALPAGGFFEVPGGKVFREIDLPAEGILILGDESGG
jgi:hypothetical protein